MDALIAAVYRRLGVDPGWEPPEIVRRACRDGIFDAAGLARLATAFAAGGKKQQEAAEGLLLLAERGAGRPVRSLPAASRPSS